MVGGHVRYTTELAKEVGRLAVFEPGRKVSPGDIVYFPMGRRKGFWSRYVPQGSFVYKGNLKDYANLEAKIGTVGNGHESTLCFRVLSSSGASFSLGSSVSSALPHLPVATGNVEMTVDFSKEGTTYFAAWHCWEQRLENLELLKTTLSPREIPGEAGFFVVSSVMLASRAIIMQAATSGAHLKLSGSAEMLTPVVGGESVLPKGKVNVGVSSASGANLHVEWSEDSGRPIFIELMRVHERDNRIAIDAVHTNSPTRTESETCSLSILQSYDLF